MPIRIVCRCKRYIVLPDKYAGHDMKCPECGGRLRIPSEKEDRDLLRWHCACGQHLKARLRSAGRTIACPRCKAETVVPFPQGFDAYIEEKFTMNEDSGLIEVARPEKADEPESETDVSSHEDAPAFREDSPSSVGAA